MPTVDKVTFPLRLPPKMYNQIREKVNELKKMKITLIGELEEI